MNTSTRIIKNTIYLYFKSIISMVVMLFVTRIVLRSLGVIDYGIYNVMIGSISLLVFFRSSLTVTMQRFFNHYQGKNELEWQKKTFNIGVVFHWIIALILIFLFAILYFPLFNGILSIPIDRMYAAKATYLCLIVSTFLSIVTVPYEATITAHENMLFYSIIGIAESLLKLIVALIVVSYENDKLILYSILMIGVPFFETIAMRFYCKRMYAECQFNPQKIWDKKLALDIYRFAGVTMLGSSSSVIGNYGANIALNHFFGAAINAVVGIANQIQGVIAVLQNGLQKSLSPVIFKAEGGGAEDKMLWMSLIGCKYSTLFFSILAIPVFILAPNFLQLWLIDVPEWTVLFVRLQIVRAFIEQLGFSLLNPLNAKKKIKLLNYSFTFLNLSPLLILVMLYSCGFYPYWHYIIMISVMAVGQNITMLYLCKRYCDLSYRVYFRMVILPCMIIVLFSLLAGVIISYLFNGFSKIVITVISIIAVFLVSYYFTMSREEKQKISILIGKSII